MINKWIRFFSIGAITLLLSANSKHKLKYTIDGSNADWDKSKLISLNIGGTKKPTFNSDVDIQHFYMDIDRHYLYIYFSVAPNLVKRYSQMKSSGIIAYLYIDSDNNKTTGVNKKDSSGNKAMIGSETLIWVPLSGASKLKPGSKEKIVSCFISHWDKTNRSFDEKVTSDKYSNISKFIKYSEKGVEIALERKDLNIKDDNDFKFTVIEWANNSPEQASSIIFKNLKFTLIKK